MSNSHIGEIQVVLPAHNEGEAIGETLSEFYRVAHDADGIDVSFVVSEDGSTDNTVEVVTELAKTLPIILLSALERKGYSRAVLDALKETTAPLVAFVDSDGQCDPTDMKRLIEALGDHDLVVGYRHPRKDPWFRLLFSFAFGLVYKLIFPVRLKDPSCPFILIKRATLERLLADDATRQLGVLKQGFWWEFNARLQAKSVDLIQIPIAHRVRTAGVTQVYRWKRLPGIASDHLKSLFVLRNEIKADRTL